MMVIDSTRMSLLHWAAVLNDDYLLGFWLVPGVGLNPQDERGRTPLSYAVASNAVAAVEWLVASPADLNLADERGWCPLHVAAANGNAAVVRTLLDHGADRHARSVDGETPLDVARRHDHGEAIAALGA